MRGEKQQIRKGMGNKHLNAPIGEENAYKMISTMLEKEDPGN
jgi:hypothetical protein